MELAADGNIIVADHLNERLFILNSNLEFIQDFSPHKSYYPLLQSLTEYRPRKMVIDQANGRMFVAENIWKTLQMGEGKDQYGDRLSVLTFV